MFKRLSSELILSNLLAIDDWGFLNFSKISFLFFLFSCFSWFYKLDYSCED